MTALVNGHNNNKQTVCVSLQNMFGRTGPICFTIWLCISPDLDPQSQTGVVSKNLQTL